MPLHRQQSNSIIRSHSSVKARRLHIVPSTSIETQKEHFYRTPSPFNLLPLELQIEIFTNCLPPFPHLSDGDETPLLFSRVCKAWKSVVFSTPKLWSSFGIEVIGTGSRVSASACDVDTANTMKLWLELSKSYPLAVRIVHVPVGRLPDMRSAQLLGALIPEARRWRHVELIIPTVNMSALQQSLPHDFPALQSFTLQLKGAAAPDSPFDLSRLNIPWHQLTALDLQLEYDNLITLDRCLDILSQTRKLTRCSIDAFCTLERPDAYADGIILPTLEELHLNLHGNNRVLDPTTHRPGARLTKFINLLTLTNLHTFHLGWLIKEPASWSQTHPGFLGFLQGVSDSLQTLSLDYIPLSERELLDCLSRVPHVIRLDLRFSLSDPNCDPITERLFAECTLPSSALSESVKAGRTQTKSNAILPLLEHLTIQCHGKGHTPASLVAFIESRWTGRSHRNRQAPDIGLKSFHKLSMNLPLVFLDRRVKRWRDEGLDIALESLVVR